MKLKSIEDIETKYPGISEKDGWLDLHMKRGVYAFFIWGYYICVLPRLLYF